MKSKNNAHVERDKEILESEAMMLNHEIVKVIKKLMAQNGIKTSKELAHQLNISPAHLSKLFSSDKFVNIELLVKLQRVFKTLFVFTAEGLEIESAHNAKRGKVRKLSTLPEQRRNGPHQSNSSHG